MAVDGLEDDTAPENALGEVMDAIRLGLRALVFVGNRRFCY